MGCTLRSANGGIAKGHRMDPAERKLLIVTVLCIGFLSWLAWAIYGGLGLVVFWLLMAWNYEDGSFPGLRG